MTETHIIDTVLVGRNEENKLNYDRTIELALQYRENITHNLYFEFTPEAIYEMGSTYDYNYKTFYMHKSNPVFINGIQFDYTKNKINDTEEFKRLWTSLLPATRDVLIKWCIPSKNNTEEDDTEDEEALCYLEEHNKVKDTWEYTIDFHNRDNFQTS